MLFLRICNRSIKCAFYINFFLFANDIMEIYNFSVSKMNIFQCYSHFFNIPQTLSISYFFLVLSEFRYAKILIESIVWILLSLSLLKLILLILIFGKSYFSLLNCCCKFLKFFDSIKNCSYVSNISSTSSLFCLKTLVTVSVLLVFFFVFCLVLWSNLLLFQWISDFLLCD